MGQMLNFKRPDGGSTQGYLASAGQNKPSIVVIQEWWGLSDQICGVADRFARAGYTALAPDLFKGRIAANADEAKHLMDGLDFGDATNQDLRGAIHYLKTLDSDKGDSTGGKVGVMGFCMGGALAIAAAVHVPELAAAVCFYGVPPPQVADPAKIKIPFQGHFANDDDWITPKVVDTLEQGMRGAGRTPEIFRYDAAHAFFNERRAEVYDANCASIAWERMLSFLGKTLCAPSP
jgi:carboxymethylenebutenolidase